MRLRSNAAIALFLVTAGTTATGYLRELILAHLFGAGAAMDAFYFSLALVQTLHDLLFVGTLGATIVPLLHARDVTSTSNLAERARVVVTATAVVAIFASMLALILWLAMPHIIDFTAPRMSAQVRANAIAYSSAIIWSIPATALITLFTLVLNAHHRFLAAAVAFLLNNFIFVGVLMLLAPALSDRVLPTAALAGPAVITPLLAVQLGRMGLLRRVTPDLSWTFFQPFWRLSRSLVFSLGVGSTSGLLMASHLITRSFAAQHGEGAIAALGYAFRLYEVPLSLVANPAATLAFPTIAALYVAGRMGDIARICRQLLFWGLIILFPAAIVTWGAADSIVRLLLERGNFDENAVRVTAEALRGFAPAVMMEAVFVVLFRVFYALHRPGLTVLAAAAALSSLVIFLSLTGDIAFIAIPLSLSAAFAVAACLLVTLLFALVGVSGLPDMRHLLPWALSAVLAFGAWRLVAWGQTDDVGSRLVALGVFLSLYSFLILALLPDCRRVVSGFVQSIVGRAG